MNKLKILLTSTSFQDTPGHHHKLLHESGYIVDQMRGPLSKNEIISHIASYDGLLCGDDFIDRDVIDAGRRGNLKVISKYGVGLDKLDISYAKSVGILTTNCPGVNHSAVAEHVLALILTYNRNIHLHSQETYNNKWIRYTGHQVQGAQFGIIGFGAIGRAVAERANAFGCKIHYYDPYVSSDTFIDKGFQKHRDLESILAISDIVSLHLPLNDHTKGMVNLAFLNQMKKGSLLVNTSRGAIVENIDLVEVLTEGYLRGYLCDVLEHEPMLPNHPLAKRDNVIITPHIGSRTYQSVEIQGIKAVENLNASFRSIE
jgi:D-3-phosphoglycerate dehydrogenase